MPPHSHPSFFEVRQLFFYLLSLVSLAAASEQRALVRLSVACMRSRPSHTAEQTSQALMGTPVKILEKGPEWSRVETPDCYHGWIINHSMVFPTAEEMQAWSNAEKAIITATYELRDADCRTDLVAGDVLVIDGDSLCLPDGRKILAPAGAFEPLNRLSAKPFNPARLPRTAELYMGSPYLWGGLSPKGMDCSGLVRIAYAAQGRLLARDASQQIHLGVEVPADSLQAGDLLFVGDPKTGRITHVAIYDRDGEFVHSSQLVRRNSLDPKSPLYLPYNIVARRRIAGIPMSSLYK